jgi:hypothetical protein
MQRENKVVASGFEFREFHVLPDSIPCFSFISFPSIHAHSFANAAHTASLMLLMPLRLSSSSSPSFPFFALAHLNHTHSMLLLLLFDSLLLSSSCCILSAYTSESLDPRVQSWRRGFNFKKRRSGEAPDVSE